MSHTWNNTSIPLKWWMSYIKFGSHLSNEIVQGHKWKKNMLHKLMDVTRKQAKTKASIQPKSNWIHNACY